MLHYVSLFVRAPCFFFPVRVCGTFRFKELNLKVSALSAARLDLKVLGQDLHFPGGPVTKRPGKLHCKRTSK